MNAIADIGAAGFLARYEAAKGRLTGDSTLRAAAAAAFKAQGLPGANPSAFLLGGGCLNCHSQVHGSNSPSGRAFMR